MMLSSPKDVLESKNWISALVDIQMIYVNKIGFLIKEMAVRNLTTDEIIVNNFRHDVISPYFVLDNGDLHTRDKYTHLPLKEGNEPYSDLNIVNMLSNYQLIFIKGENKKNALVYLFQRQYEYVRPIVINIDSSTSSFNDRSFLNRYSLKCANFSFMYMYKYFKQYLNMIKDKCSPDQLVFVHKPTVDICKSTNCNNIVVCMNDHGDLNFTNFQRCALFNLDIVYNLWFNDLDDTFRLHYSSNR